MSETTIALGELDRTVCENAKRFCQLYYDNIDKKRTQLGQMYNARATAVWNGNAMEGQQAIGEFLMELPKSEFRIKSLDAQHVNDKVTEGKQAMLLLVGGSVTFGVQVHCFTQSFIVAEDDGKWRIFADRFRFVD